LGNDPVRRRNIYSKGQLPLLHISSIKQHRESTVAFLLGRFEAFEYNNYTNGEMLLHIKAIYLVLV
jgi:hypothetical protein